MDFWYGLISLRDEFMDLLMVCIYGLMVCIYGLTACIYGLMVCIYGFVVCLYGLEVWICTEGAINARPKK
jgi:hypothetical protein